MLPSHCGVGYFRHLRLSNEQEKFDSTFGVCGFKESFSSFADKLGLQCTNSPARRTRPTMPPLSPASIVPTGGVRFFTQVSSTSFSLSAHVNVQTPWTSFSVSLHSTHLPPLSSSVLLQGLHSPFTSCSRSLQTGWHSPFRCS